MRRGDVDYLPKPYTPDQLRLVLERSASMRHLQADVENLQDQVRTFIPEADLATQEPAMQQALDLAFKAAASEPRTLLPGESGTGKGVLPRAIHAPTPRARGPFLTVHSPPLSAASLQ